MNKTISAHFRITSAECCMTRVAASWWCTVVYGGVWRSMMDAATLPKKAGAWWCMVVYCE